MPLLVKIIGPQAGTQFVDDSSFQHVSDAEFKFEDSLGVLRLSDDKFAGHRLWSDDILSIDPIALRMDQPYGGMVRISGAGKLDIAMSAFFNAGSDWWFPAVSYPVSISYTAADEDTATVLMLGTIYRTDINPPLSVSFTLFPEALDKNLLQTDTDYDGNTVVIPRAFGNVKYVKPVRVADEGGTGYRRYRAGSIVGTKHVDWHVYDDGVDVCSNAVDHLLYYDIISYTVTPVGQITISGSGIYTSGTGCWDVFSLLCQSTWLNVQMTAYDAALNGLIDRWQDTQIRVVDFLSLVAASTENYFYILQGFLYLHRMNTSDYGTLAMDVNQDTLEGTKYVKTTPKSIARYTYKKREVVEETIGKYVKETSVDAVAVSPYPYGQDISIDTMTETLSVATSRLIIALTYFIALRSSLSLSLSALLLRPGTRISLIDTRYTGAVLTSTPLYVRDIVYDFMGKKMNIEGEITSLVVT